jgi:hypothetical protein
VPHAFYFLLSIYLPISFLSTCSGTNGTRGLLKWSLWCDEKIQKFGDVHQTTQTAAATTPGSASSPSAAAPPSPPAAAPSPLAAAPLSLAKSAASGPAAAAILTGSEIGPDLMPVPKIKVRLFCIDVQIRVGKKTVPILTISIKGDIFTVTGSKTGARSKKIWPRYDV